MMATKIYQIKISLNGCKPKIWRRVLIKSDMLLADLHKVIQTTMGWSNSHLHQFVKNRTYYSCKVKGDDSWDDMDMVDYKKMKVSDLLAFEKEHVIYEYDFGDSWQHEVLLEKILPIDAKTTYPVCIKGKMNCPPDDCGGIWGYANMLEVIKQPNHEEYEDLMDWLGGEFDPEFFDVEDVNELLKEKDYGCFTFF